MASGSNFAAIATPLRQWAQRFALLLLAGLAVLLLVLARAEPGVVARLRMVVLDAATLPLTALRQPVDATVAAITYLQSWSAVREENARLKVEIEALREVRQAKLRLELELATLRSQSNIAAEVAPRYITARVVADAGGPFARGVLLAAGRKDGVRRGQPVVNAEGLVGRIADVGERSAVVVLLTDINSRIPVLAGSARAVAAGENGAQLRLNFLPGSASLAVGDAVTTSGHGGVFPPGLAVGEVATTGDRGVRVAPAADLARLTFVRVLDFGPGGYLPPPEPSADRAGG